MILQQCQTRRWVTVWGIVLVCLCAGALVGCSGETGSVRIIASNMQFSPDDLQLPAGQPVTLTLVNSDGYAHSFDIDALNIHVPMPANTTATVTFTPEQAQQYAFYCGSTGHQKAGMAGMLVVDDADETIASDFAQSIP